MAPPGRSTEEILAAAASLFEEVGFEAFTMLALSARAGVSKSSIYKRWRSKEAILFDVLWAHAERGMQLEDTGSTTGDLRLMMKEIERTALATRVMLAEVVGQLARSDALREAVGLGDAAIRQSVAAVFRRGIDRGDLDPKMDVEVAALTAVGPITYLVQHHLPVPRNLGQRIAGHLQAVWAAP